MIKTRTWLALAVSVALVAALAMPAAAVESFTVTEVGDTAGTDVGLGWAKSFKCLKISWVANATTGTMTTHTIGVLKGKVLMGVTNPGTEAPDANYDIYILDAEGVDIFGGALNNRHTSSSEQAFPKNGTDFFVPRPVYGTMTFSLAGNTNTDATGDLFLYFVE